MNAEGIQRVIDGAFGASVRWKSFFPIGTLTALSWKRFFAVKAMENMTFFFIIGIVLCTLGGPAIVGGLIFLGIYLYIFFMTPKLVRTVYGGKFRDVQAAFFGFEGYLNTATVERAIFGGNFGRLTWSTNGSPISHAVVNEHGERFGADPTLQPEVRIKVENAKNALPGQMRVSVSCACCPKSPPPPSTNK